MNLEKKLIINRTLLFAFSIIAFPLAFLSEGITLGAGQYLMYFTIWSNIIVFIWATIAFINIYLNNDKLEAIVENWYFKTTSMMFIFITGIVFNAILLPWMIVINGFGKSILIYFGFSFMQHVLTPIFMSRDYYLTKGCRLNEKQNIKDISIKVIVLMILPAIWLLVSLPMIYFNVIDPQYPFMDLFGVSNTVLIINIFIILGIALTGIILFYISIWLTNKYSNNEIEDNQ